MDAPDRLLFGHAWINSTAADRGAPGVAVVPGRGSCGVLRCGAPKSDTSSRDFGAIRCGAHGNLVGQFRQFGQPNRDT